MFLCIFLLALVLGESSGGFIWKDPEDKFAVVGDNVTLSCTVSESSGVCDGSYGVITFHWQLKLRKSKKFQKISNCSRPLPNYARRYSVSQNGTEWKLNIRNVTENENGKYKCSVAFTKKSQPGSKASKAAVLTVIQPIETAVEPSHIKAKPGENATFLCHIQEGQEPSYSYVWYLFGKNRKREQITTSSKFSLSDNGRYLTIMEVTERQNGTYACGVFRGDVSLTRHNDSASLVVEPVEVVTDVEEPEIIAQQEVSPGTEALHSSTTPSSVDKLPANINPADGPDNAAIDNAPVRPPDDHIQTENFAENVSSPTQSIRKRVESDEDIQETTSGSKNSLAFTVAGVLAALVLTLIITFLLYFVIYKGRNETIARLDRKSHVAGADETTSNANGIVETQLDLEEAASPTYEFIPEGTRPSHSSKETTAEVLYAEPENRVVTSAKPETVRTKEAQTSVGDARETIKHQGADSPSTQVDNIQKPKRQNPVMAEKPGIVSGVAENRQQSSVKPPEVKPYQPSRQRAGNGPQDPSPSAEDQEDHDRSKDDPRKRNVEGLIYADLDLKEQGQTVVINEGDGEESVYADIVK